MTNAVIRPADPKQVLERTSFQTSSPFDPRISIGADMVMCYGLPFHQADIDRIKKWRENGYRVNVMSGVAWGEYQDYLYGRFDGIDHEDEVQTQSNGDKIGHGGDVYYMSPGINFGKYLASGVKHALDAGVEGIFLEEPEFWVRAGWSKGFQSEWKAYYHEDWQPPDSSSDAQYRASLLKYYLYQRALRQVFDFVKAYNKEHGTHAKCYVATHSLINYASWGIVSPESSLARVGADGYIAQVWTGTARTPNYYDGVVKSRTFETAFLEYGVMMNISRSIGGTVWFLADPIEDDANHSWRDYRENWQSTLTGSLLWPQVWRYEVMPWPERIFRGTQYPTTDSNERKPGEAVTKEAIPPAYATELMAVVHALNNMNQKDISWESGTQGVGVLVSDTMMFQRFGPQASDNHLGSFYGLALPLLKHGLPIEPIQLENATLPHTLSMNKVLLLTFEGMKPMKEKDSAAVAEWVKKGGALVFVDNDADPFNMVRSWWNAAPNNFESPRQALFHQLGLLRTTPAGTYKIGKGTLIYSTSSPAALSRSADGGTIVRGLVKQACAAVGLKYHETNYLSLRRGPYIVAAGLDESINTPPHVIKGNFVNLFDGALPLVNSVTLEPNSRTLLLDLDKIPGKGPQVLAAACKTLGEQVLLDGTFKFFAAGPDEIKSNVLVRLQSAPKSVAMDGTALATDSYSYNAAKHILQIRFTNAAAGHWITVH